MIDRGGRAPMWVNVSQADVRLLRWMYTLKYSLINSGRYKDLVDHRTGGRDTVIGNSSFPTQFCSGFDLPDWTHFSLKLMKKIQSRDLHQFFFYNLPFHSNCLVSHQFLLSLLLPLVFHGNLSNHKSSLPCPSLPCTWDPVLGKKPMLFRLKLYLQILQSAWASWYFDLSMCWIGNS